MARTIKHTVKGMKDTQIHTVRENVGKDNILGIK